ncbi:hypothetical protein BH09ACT11_BH09ACT11_21600 [soil metagenome]
MATASEVLAERGPLTGQDLVDAIGATPLRVWQACTADDQVVITHHGRRYVRLDESIAGWARLSPSIGREFVSFSLVHLVGQEAAAARLLDSIRARTATVTADKKFEAKRLMERAVSDLRVDRVTVPCVFLIAGDVAYGMGHDVPRPDKSTGIIVNGSDLDIVVIHADDADPAAVATLDSALHRLKARLLASPSYREELDYVVKSMATAREQITSGELRDSIAAKVLVEAEFLCGDRAMFDEVKALVAASGAPQRFEAMFESAAADRIAAERRLAAGEGTEADLKVFVGLEEQAEFS